MKRNRLHVLLCGSATIVFGVAGILAPGCEDVIGDPQAFFADDPCNFFNCDTLIFLAGEDGEVPD